MVVWLDSGLVSFLNSGHKDSNRIDSRLRSVCSRPGSAGGSAHRTSGLGSAHYSRFSLPRLVDLDRLGDQLEARRISSMLGSAGSARFAQDLDQIKARLGSLFGVQFTSARESGSTWGSLGLGESAQCSARGLSSGLSWGLTGG